MHYYKFQKEPDNKTVRTYKTNFEQFIILIGGYDLDKVALNSYLQNIHSMDKKAVKRKIVSVKVLFHYLDERRDSRDDPFHKGMTKFKENVVLPKIVEKIIIEQFLDHLYKERILNIT